MEVSKWSRESTDVHSRGLREEAVKVVVAGRVSVYEASRQLILPKSTRENRDRAFKIWELGNIG